MDECSECSESVSMPYTCRRCENHFCSSHRLPENHDCPGLHKGGPDPQVVAENARQQKQARKSTSNTSRIISLIESAIPEVTRRQLNGNISYVFLTIIGFVYICQLLVIGLFGDRAHQTLFVLTSENPEFLWTWFSSIFAHSLTTPMHIIGNSIVLLFFGPLLERTIGTRRFIGLFLSAGVLAGISQIMFGFLINDPATGVLGASGAIMAILGVLTIYKPRLSVYLYFILPIPLWLITTGYAGFSILGALTSFGSIAHMAHLMGLVIGLVYGWRTRRNHVLPNSLQAGRDKSINRNN